MDAQKLVSAAEKILLAESHKQLEDASAWELHNALSGAIMLEIAKKWTGREKIKREHFIFPWNISSADWYITICSVWDFLMKR